MKERPILFSGPMVRAILNGTKTQTRQVIKSQPDYITAQPTGCTWQVCNRMGQGFVPSHDIHCPYGKVGDQLWGRETHVCVSGSVQGGPSLVHYRADGDPAIEQVCQGLWRPSIHMPRWASRIALEITDVRVQRLHRIGEMDAKAEGVTPETVVSVERGESYLSYSAPFADLWDKINEKRGYGWDTNPYVWVVSFKRVLP